MNRSGTITSASDETGPALQRILNRIFRCRHRQLGRPMTLRGECYVVCLDCGQRLEYDLKELRPTRPSAAPSRVTAAANEEKRSQPPPKKKEEKIAPIAPPPQGHPKVQARPQPGSKQSPAPPRRFRFWKWELLWFGVFGVGLAFLGLYAIEEPPASTAHTPPNAAPTPSAAPVVETRPSVEPSPPPPLLPPNSNARLDSHRSEVILARGEGAALSVSRHPGRLGPLIRSGSLFTAPNGASVRILQRRRHVVKVMILDGPLARQQGWAQSADVAP